MKWNYPWKPATFPMNERGRDFIAGDIHGQFQVLEQALEELSFNSGLDRLFCLGDLVDRGQQSFRVQEFLKYSWFHSIAGNHEHMLLNCHADPALCALHWYPNGGGWWDDIDESSRNSVIELVESVLHAVLTVETSAGPVGLVHAMVPPGLSWQNFCTLVEMDVQTQEYAIWARDPACPDSRFVDGIDRIYCGHTPQVQVMHFGSFTNIDTGCGHTPSSRISSPALTLVESVSPPRYYRFPA